MINPLLNCRIQGVIWYQGEANVNDAMHYRKLFPAMILDWRNKFKQGDFPFYYVQIAPYKYYEAISGALLREAQLMTLSLPGTGMVVTTDIGNTEDMHPVNKQEVGRRLALIALAKAYKNDRIEYSGPLFKGFDIIENSAGIPNTIRIYFDHAGTGLVARGDNPVDFHIADKNKIFREAQVRIDGKTLLVWNDNIAEPQAVRFGFTNTDQPNLYNSEGLPASPFRTDDWQIYTGEVTIQSIVHKSKNGYQVEFSSDDPDALIRYSTNGVDPDISSRLYRRPFILKDTTEIRARAFREDIGSAKITSQKSRPHKSIRKKVRLRYPAAGRYSGGGALGLVDGIIGSEEFTDEPWLGFEAYDFHATIKLERAKHINNVQVRFLENQVAWIFLPAYVDISYSLDGKTYTSAKKIITSYDENKEGIAIEVFETDFSKENGRINFIKIYGKNLRRCPAWHPGAGDKAWIFADEIIIE
jgi:hypothetical protein